MKRSWLRSAGSLGLALPVLVALLSVVGYVVTSETIRGDRDAAARRRLDVDSEGAQAALGRARAYVAGLGNVLAGEPVPAQRRFAQLAGGTAGGVGLVDAMWVRRVRGSLAATFTTETRPELRPGVDVSGWPALAAAVRGRAPAFTVSASGVGSLGDRPGFYLLEAGRYGHRTDSRGALVVFVPQGWLTGVLRERPGRIATSVDGRRLEGLLDSPPAGSASFSALARRWRIDVAAEPATGLQTLVPWLAVAWPIAVALIVVLIARAIVRRRKAEREADRIFELSLDLLCTTGLDGYIKRVNPAFAQALGYSRQHLLSRPFLEFMHPDDRRRTQEAFESLARGHEVVEFEDRYVHRDGSVRWLQWNARPVPEEGLIYAAARDVTERRRAEDQLRVAQRMVETSRDEQRVLADEQAALRRVATLVARAAPPEDVFAAVTEEIGQLLPVEFAHMGRYGSDGSLTFVTAWGRSGTRVAVGNRLSLGGKNLGTIVFETCRPARIDRYDETSGPLAVSARRLGFRSAVGAPIIVDGHLWGMIGAASDQEPPLPADTEARLANFTDLLATAIANAEARAQLTASRARIIATADETRRQIERDLHDGAQQRLVSLALDLRAVEAQMPPGDERRARLAQTAGALAGVVEDLQEMSRGIHPAILSRGGLRPALKALARRSAVPVELDVRTDGRLPERVEVAAYYVVSESLTNVAKHAHASVVHVYVEAVEGVLRLAVRDDGAGGADPNRGSGLVGLKDRVETLGGAVSIKSPVGAGTSVEVELPLDR